MFSNGGSDHLFGGAGDDVARGGDGRDVLDGGVKNADDFQLLRKAA
jgi:Ca2+-binding RTX toxin-like protein